MSIQDARLKTYVAINPAFLEIRNLMTYFSTGNNFRFLCTPPYIHFQQVSQCTINISTVKTAFSFILVLIYYWFWLGLTDLHSEGKYVLSHSSNALNDSGNWFLGEPDNANTNQHCVYIRYQDGRFQWGDTECNTDFIEHMST